MALHFLALLEHFAEHPAVNLMHGTPITEWFRCGDYAIVEYENGIAKNRRSTPRDAIGIDGPLLQRETDFAMLADAGTALHPPDGRITSTKLVQLNHLGKPIWDSRNLYSFMLSLCLT
jgi:hypothetical protein